jgi:transketolase N-terminal domain/subunit
MESLNPISSLIISNLDTITLSCDMLNIEIKIINTLRILSIDMIERANSGHPGMPLGCAPIMYILWCKIMNFNPEKPLWDERDRFILSNGHGCALLYSILYLLRYNYKLEDLKNFRQLHSKTPGHPEYNQLLGIEISTGPLGQGIANGVGMAIASKKLGLNNNIYVMCGDGCLMEGISYEATSLAGHLELNNLIILYDDNKITIDGSTDITFTENTKDRFIALNWNILEIENGNGENENDLNDIYNKLLIAKSSENKPTIIFNNGIIIIPFNIGIADDIIFKQYYIERNYNKLIIPDLNQKVKISYNYPFQYSVSNNYYILPYTNNGEEYNEYLYLIKLFITDNEDGYVDKVYIGQQYKFPITLINLSNIKYSGYLVMKYYYSNYIFYLISLKEMIDTNCNYTF